LLVLLLAAASAYLGATIRPLEAERQTRRMIEAIGGDYRTEPAGPELLHDVAPDLFQNTVHVDLSAVDFDQACVERIMGDLPKLQTLAVSGCQFDDQQFSRLSHLQSLRAVLLDSTTVSDDAVLALRAQLPELLVFRTERKAASIIGNRTFGMDGHDFTQIDTPHAPSPPLVVKFFGDRHAETVTVKCARLLDESLHAPYLATCRSLEALILRGDRGNPYLTSLATQFPDVTSLYLYSVESDDRTLSIVSRFPTLQEIHVAGDKHLITDAGVAHLGKCMHLTVVSIHCCSRITDASCHLLSRVPSLEKIILHGDIAITDDGIAALASLQRLRLLYIIGSRMHVTANGIRMLAQCPNLSDLDLETGRAISIGKHTLPSRVSLAHARDLLRKATPTDP
jgi:hypothetical protein